MPNVVEIFDAPISVQFQMNAHGLLNKQELYINSMKNTIRDNSDNNNCNGLLLWLTSTTVSVIVKEKKIVVFDSHARDHTVFYGFVAFQ